jgi:hypothetical protein
MVTVNTADRTGNVVERNRFWRGRVVLCVPRCTRAGTRVVGCPHRAVSNFFENSRRYSQLKVDHWYQRHRWQICHQCQRRRRQILPPVSLVAKLPPVSTMPAANLPPVSTTPVANCHRYQRHRRQTMGTISSCRYLKVNLKAKIYIDVKCTIQRCPNKIFKIFLIEDFFHLPPVSTTRVVNLELRKNLKRS